MPYLPRPLGRTRFEKDTDNGQIRKGFPRIQIGKNFLIKRYAALLFAARFLSLIAASAYYGSEIILNTKYPEVNTKDHEIY